ncbi:MAG: hypothetical protein AAGA65_28310 [Actinomycetota bacterium]
MCYGEFCWNCLVETKGRQKPMCRECALVVSGLRPKSKAQIRGSKKTVKERREALRAAREAPRQGLANFTFFDMEEDGQLPTPPDWEPPPPDPLEEPVHAISEMSAQDPIAADVLSETARDDHFLVSDEATSAGAESAIQRLTNMRETRETAETGELTASTVVSDHQPPWGPTTAEAEPTPSPLDADPSPVDAEPVEFPGPRPFVTDQRRLAAMDHQQGGRRADDQGPVDAPQARRRPEDERASDQRIVSQRRTDQQVDAPEEIDPQDGGEHPVDRRRAEQGPIDGQPSPYPPQEFALPPRYPGATGDPDGSDESTTTEPPTTEPPTKAEESTEPDEEFSIHDDPWARTGQRAGGANALPKRRPNPKPGEDRSASPPDWTKAKLPKFD